ncbi:MAG: Spy/CpxP family protein refolding chaperone [Pyrinomonadaceae bacterium]
MRIKRAVLSLLAIVTTFVGAPTSAFSIQQQQPETQLRTPVGDPIQELNLSPEQREKIREVREQLREARAATAQRLRETNWALEQALDADNPDEAHLDKLMLDVAEAQAASMRMRILSEVRIRRILTAEQLATLRQLRRMARERRRDRQLDNVDRRRQEVLERRRSLPRRRDSLRPLLPRRLDPQARPNL